MEMLNTGDLWARTGLQETIILNEPMDLHLLKKPSVSVAEQSLLGPLGRYLLLGPPMLVNKFISGSLH